MKRRALRMAAPALALLLLAARGGAEPRADFVLNCAGCHKFDGSGSQVVPALREVGRVAAAPGGREYLARVPGVAQAPLSDARLAALLNWLVNEFGGAPPPRSFTAGEVGVLRAAPLRDPLAARAALPDLD